MLTIIIIIIIFSVLSERQFMGTYRLSKVLVEELIHTLTPFMKIPNTLAGISIQKKVFTY